MSDSYYMDTTPINIHLEYQDAETKTITAKAVKENTQTTNVVSKVDVTGSKEDGGCKLEITDASGKKGYQLDIRGQGFGQSICNREGRLPEF